MATSIAKSPQKESFATIEKINEDEAALYDRQIRLWGLDAQNRLRNSSVLLIGIPGLGAEVAKNLMLAGLKSLTILDDKTVSESDRSAQFLIPFDSIGENRAEASLPRLQELNSLVEVKIETGKATEKNAEFFGQFDLICAVGQNLGTLFFLNEICRESGIKFCAGQVFGSIGFCFLDFLTHEYAEEEKKIPIAEELDTKEESDSKSRSESEPASKKSKISVAEIEKSGPENSKNLENFSESEKKIVKKVENFVSMKKSLEIDWNSKENSAKLRKIPSAFFIIQILYKFEEIHGRFPNENDADFLELLKIRENFLKEFSIPDRIFKIPNEFPKYCVGELGPIAAIVGGILGQEIIKALSQIDAPLNNYFFYNMIEFSGMVAKLPPKFD